MQMHKEAHNIITESSEKSELSGMPNDQGMVNLGDDSQKNVRNDSSSKILGLHYAKLLAILRIRFIFEWPKTQNDRGLNEIEVCFFHI